MSITQELLYLLLLYAVLGDNVSLTTALLIAFGIILLGPCLSKLCCNNGSQCPGTTTSSVFSALNNVF